MNKSEENISDEQIKSSENLDVKEENSEQTKAGGVEEAKKIEITAKELANIQKQLKKLEKVKKENEEFRKYIEALEKRQEELKKSDVARRGMEEQIKELQKLVDKSSKIEERAKREQSKYRELYRNENEINASLKAEVDELRNISSQYFLLKQEASRLNNQCRTLKQAREQYPMMVKKYEEAESVADTLKEQIQKKDKQLEEKVQVIEKFEKKVEKMHEEMKMLEKEKLRIVCEKEELGGEIDALKEQLQDERTEFEVLNRKNVNEIKQLKVALHQEHEKLRITEEQLQQSRKNSRPTVNLQTTRMADLHKEDLFNLLEESEMKIVSLKIALDEASEKLSSTRAKLQEKDASIIALSREITKAHPNLDESEGMDYVEKDIIEMGKIRKDDWGEIVEKVMLENLRLKYSVTALGEEYNSRMRSEK